MSFHSRPIIWIGVTNRKRSNQSQIVGFSPNWKIIWHLFYATLSFVHHFVAICELQLELYSGKAHIGANLRWPLWPLPLTFDLLYGHNTFVNGKNSWTFHYDTMTGTLWKRCDRRTDGKDRSYSCLVAAKKDNTQNYDRHRHLKFVNPCILSCNRLCRHVWNVLGRYLLCMDAWHFINKTFISIYFIKFPDLSLKYHSDLYSYRKNQDFVYGKGSTTVLGKNKIQSNASCGKKKTPHKLPS